MFLRKHALFYQLRRTKDKIKNVQNNLQTFYFALRIYVRFSSICIFSLQTSHQATTLETPSSQVTGLASRQMRLSPFVEAPCLQKEESVLNLEADLSEYRLNHAKYCRLNLRIKKFSLYYTALRAGSVDHTLQIQIISMRLTKILKVLYE